MKRIALEMWKWVAVAVALIATGLQLVFHVRRRESALADELKSATARAEEQAKERAVIGVERRRDISRAELQAAQDQVTNEVHRADSDLAAHLRRDGAGR